MTVYMDLENLLKEKNISKNKVCEALRRKDRAWQGKHRYWYCRLFLGCHLS